MTAPRDGSWETVIVDVKRDAILKMKELSRFQESSTSNVRKLLERSLSSGEPSLP
jgi:hypothetical protein